MQVTPLDHPWFGPFAALLVVILAATLGMGLPGRILEPLIVENGPFEVASICLHLLVAAIALVNWRKGQSIAGILFFASLLMAAREADLHKAFTTYGIFGTRLYFSSYVPVHQKILALTAIMAMLTTLALLVRRALPDIKRLRHENRPAFYSLATLPLFLVALKEIDGLPRMLLKVGVMLSQRETLVSRSIEEIGETFIPLLVLTVVVQITRGYIQLKSPATLSATA